MNPLAFFKCLRPRQWTKNLLLFAGLIFTRQWDDWDLIYRALAGFAIFCALSGVVYIINDILDIEKDREHPKKKNRPIASGAITPTAAGAGGALLLVASLIGAYFLGLGFFLSSCIYVLLVSGYSMKFKHVAVLDIMLLAVGFVIRAIAGIEVIDVHPEAPVEITPFFIMTTLFLALFLAIAKRFNEIKMLGESAAQHRRVLGDYSEKFLETLITIATAGVIMSYSAWSTSGDFARDGGNSYTMVFTLPFVVYGIFRYLWLVYQKGEGGAPEEVLLTDKPLLVAVLGWLITVVALLSMGG